MTTTDALHGAIGGDGDTRTLTLDPRFGGLPDTAHGGSVLAVFDALAGRSGARTLRGHYLRRVPLATPLALRLARANDAARFTLLDGAATLVDGAVEAATAGHAIIAVEPPPQDALPLPISRGCFACGTDNPLGVGVRLRADDATVGATWNPRPGFRRPDGTLAPLALTTLLDEAAFWLGVLATGESGMTTELRVTLHAEAKADAAITVSGARAAVRPRAGDARYWDTTIAARDGAGRVVASGAITFVAVRGAARRLAAGMLAVNEEAILRRVFPTYVP
jgi:acyl-coenzyme A thioesterase PaaI-like protein